MFYQIFLSLQVKRCAIIAYKHSIYDLSYELLNHLASQEMRKHYESIQTPLNDMPVPSPTPPKKKIKILLILAKTLQKIARTFFTRKLEAVPNIP